MDLEPALSLLQDEVNGLVAVYLFGSAARHQDGPESDVDLAFLAARSLNDLPRYDLQENIAMLLKRDVDLVDLRKASTVMRAQVVATGEVILDCDPTARVAFEVTAYSAYAHLNEERKGILEDAGRVGVSHG